MFELQGKYNTAKIFSNNKDDKAAEQIVNLLNQDFTFDAQIRIMPDYHYGAGCTIGFTANLGKKVVPNLVGVDLGCGVLIVNLGKIDIDLNILDKIIHEKIPFGRENHKGRVTKFDKINNLICYRELKDQGNFDKAIGSLGGGNHYIEIDQDEYGNKYLNIHSGSRNMGKRVAEFYQSLAIENCKGLGNLNEEKDRLISRLKENGNKHLIQSSLKQLEQDFFKTQPKYPRDLCFLEGYSRESYLYDMKICQEYAWLNRETMANIILGSLFFGVVNNFEHFQSVHNYINFDDNIIRKGAVSAYEGEKLVIPINMRDGALICTGKGNSDWNNSAPHGAGRLMGRNEAMRKLNIDDFVESMNGIYTTTANSSTLDEAPMVYKPMQEIIDNIQDTVSIINIIKPIYNFKASE